MNSIVERLRGFKSAAAQVWAHEAADMIEQQAERIKELEAEIGIGHLQCIADRQKYKQDLVALRQRIADAPVVAWLHPNAEIFRKYVPNSVPLISKEDLL